MKGFPVWRALVAGLLLGVLVVLSPAPLALAASRMTPGTLPANGTSHQDSGPGPIFACLGGIAFTVAATLLDHEELSFGLFTGSVPTCIDAVFTLFNNPPNPTASSPQIEIHGSSSDSASYGSVPSALVQNCSDNWETLQFSFSVPFKMVVGSPQSPEGREEFNASPSGSTDDELIAQQLFQQYGIASKITSGPSQVATYNVPPHTQATLNLPIVLYYKSGGARVVHPDGSTVVLPWLFTDGYQQTGPITTSTRSSC